MSYSTRSHVFPKNDKLLLLNIYTPQISQSTPLFIDPSFRTKQQLKKFPAPALLLTSQQSSDNT